ncbi:hypothetical protein LSAT2_019496 [Lamellibrachia satsuma]|nr:hypothetical protein LSAT2_019496 [Lamellibrachia satsuma]
MRRIQGLNLELLLLGATTSYLPTGAIERPNGDRHCEFHVLWGEELFEPLQPAFSRAINNCSFRRHRPLRLVK